MRSIAVLGRRSPALAQSPRDGAGGDRQRELTLADQQPAPEHALERLVVAVALDAPTRQRQVAGRPRGAGRRRGRWRAAAPR